MNPHTDAEIGAVVLALADLYADPERSAAAAEAAALLTPTGHSDQLTAAAEDTRAVLELVAPLMGGTSGDISPADLPDWVRLTLLDTLTRWHTGRARTCLHNPDPDRPQPVYAAAWSPGLIVCTACAHLVDPRRGTVKDRTCDRCGHVTRGVEHGDGIHPCAVTWGPMLYAWGACTTCHEPAAESTVQAAA